MKKNKYLFSAQLILTFLCCAFLIIPVIQSVLIGLSANAFRGISSGLTLRWVIEVWVLYSDSIFRSLFIGFVTLFVCLIAGVPAAYFMVRSQSRWIKVLEEVLVLPLAIPGLAIALGILITYGGYTDFRRSWMFILCGHVIFCLPFMVRSVASVMAMIDLTELEEGAASLGASFSRRFLQIIVPNVMPGIVSGALMVFTLSIGEFNLTWMLHTPLTKTLPVGLADSYASMRLEIGSAYTIYFFALIIPLLVAMQWVGSRSIGHVSQQADQDDVLEVQPMTANISSQKKSGVTISLTSCGKTFPDGTVALTPQTFTIEAGQTVVLLGPSGCGKTTTLRIIAGLESPDEGGCVYFGDKDVTHIPIEKRNVGMVFQSYALFPNMSVYRNIEYGLHIRGDEKEKRAKRVKEMLSMMQIEHLADRKINQLSGGQRQRVALARAIAVRPSVLLLDEPLSALDAKLRDSLREEIDTLLKRLNITTVYVTHDQSEAMSLGDVVVVMKDGDVMQMGSPQDIYFNPQQKFVADFIGTVNMVPCRIQDDSFVFPNGYAVPCEMVVGNNGTLLQGTANIFFRPENTVVQSAEGMFKGEILSSVFLGDKNRLKVKLNDMAPCVLDIPGDQTFVAGETIHFDVPTQALGILPEAS